MSESTHLSLDQESILKADIQKIHGEINLLINQRFTLTISAITAVLVISAWIFPRHEDVVNHIAIIRCSLGSILINCILLIMFQYIISLRQKMRMLSEYLHINALSIWEHHYQLVKRKKKELESYTHPQYWIFSSLSALSTLMPLFVMFVINVIGAEKQNFNHYIVIPAISLGAFVFIYIRISAMGKIYKSTLQAREYWRMLFVCKEKFNTNCQNNDLNETTTIPFCNGLDPKTRCKNSSSNPT